VHYICCVKLDHNNIAALVRLVDDPDQRVSGKAMHELALLGRIALPFIDTRLNSTNNINEIQHLLQLQREIKFEEAYSGMKSWLSSDEKDLMHAITIVAESHFEGFDSLAFNHALDRLISDTWKELNPRQTSFEVINTINTILFDFYKLEISEIDVLPQHAFPHVILEDRLATSFGLSLLYAGIASKLNIPIYMVVLPGRCYLVHLHHYANNLLFNNEVQHIDAHFFIDPLDQCRIKSIHEVAQEVKLFKEYDKHVLSPSPHSLVIKSFLQELILSYHCWNGSTEKSKRLEDILTLFD
jgi:regulator of sirC expression with transglutaminase-like and TPR domain